ncbi:MAG: hypothetical protein NZ901_05525 [Geminocystis sp.]|nr:hypothetical protein [Geminocystis sp.]MDW8115329.1 hypothetical protein [Geminocystis sp.]
MKACQYKIVHQVRGRVRLRIFNLTKTTEEGLARCLSNPAGVESYRFNHAASCLVI